MKKTLTFCDFCDEFSKERRNYYTYEAKQALFDYYEELDDNWECDIISICGDWSEYENIEEVLQNYDNIKDLNDLKDNTQVIELKNGRLLVYSF